MAEARWAKLEFKAGLVKDDTPLAAEGGYVAMDLMRFSRGRPQVIGGWENARATVFTYPVRGAHAWATLAGDRVLAYGTADKLLALYGGSTLDLTPLKARGTLVDPFTTENGSATVVVIDQDHGLNVDDVVTYANADAVGGLTINGDYTVVAVQTLDQYTITAGSTASSTATGGGSVEFSVPLDMGLVNGSAGTGYGTGLWGVGLYGLPSGGNVHPRTWSLHNFGNDLVAVPRNGALYRWQPGISTSETISNGAFSSSTGWTLGTGWSISGGKLVASAGTASDAEFTVTGLINGGLIYEAINTVVRSAGALQFQIVSADGPTTVDVGQPFIKSATYTRRFIAPSNPTKVIFRKDASFAGEVDDFSVKIATTATRLTSAPQYSVGGFVDPNRIMVLYGTIEADGDYNPMLVRWSNQEDLTTWIPDDDNLAGEFSLAKGSRIVGALASRGQNIISTDDAIYTMRFTGDTASVFQFDLAGTGCGWLGKNAAADVNGRVFWWGRDGNFYVYQGGIPQIIDCPLRRDANDNLSPSQQEKVYCGSNPRYNEVVWMYPDKRLGTECNRMIVYNYVEDHWSEWTLDRTTWVPNGIYDNPIGFSAAGVVYFHERGETANGATMPWTLTTAFTDVEDGNYLTALMGYQVDFEEQSGIINFEVLHRMRPNATVRTKGPYPISTTTLTRNFRVTARQLAFRWSAGVNAGFARWGAVAVQAAPTSARQ